jgi:hypothetical protein
MRRQRALMGLRRVVATLVMLIGSAGGVQAAPIPYQTQGQTWPWTYGNGALPGYSGVNAIQFQPVDQGAIQLGVPFALGSFAVSPLAAGTSTTYNHSAFSITLNLNPAGQTPQTAPFSSISLYGALDGTISGSGLSNVVAQVLSIQPNSPVQILGSTPNPLAYQLPFPLSALSVEPVTLSPASAGGQTPIMAVVTPLPEPSSVLVALAMAAGGFLAAGRWLPRQR